MTELQYEELVRIFKNIKNDMVNDMVYDKTLNADTISSFLIESLIYNLPIEEYRYSDWDNTIRNAIHYLWDGLNQKQCNNWTEPSECIYLFHSNRKWTQRDAQDFLLKMWRYLGYK